MGAIRRMSLADPAATRDALNIALTVGRLGSHTIGYAIVQPGFRWSTTYGPTAGTSSCQVHHVQVFLTGRFGVRMDDGEEVEFGPLDVGDIPPGHDAWVIGDEPVQILDFAGHSDAIGMPREHERIVTTLLMTDIVDSTATASRLGDAAWREVLADHNRLIRAQFVRFGGSEVNTTGDGFLATFRSAVAALRCAAAIVEAVREAVVKSLQRVPTPRITSASRAAALAAVVPVAPIAPRAWGWS